MKAKNVLIQTSLLAASAFARPAAAQTLTLQAGDSVIVGGSGTFGVYHGKYLNNTVTSYSTTASNGSAVSTTNNSYFELDSGGNLSATGFGGDGVTALGSTLQFFGGTITGGPSSYSVSEAFSSITINGGTFHGGLNLVSSTLAAINGGTISGGSTGDGIDVTNGTLGIHGGTISGGVRGIANSGGTTNIDGGSISSSGIGLYISNGGIIDLFGTFNGYDSTTVITSGTGVITGTLANGQRINTTYSIASGSSTLDGTGSKIIFNGGIPVTPEPSQTVIMALGMGIGTVVLARRASTAANRVRKAQI